MTAADPSLLSNPRSDRVRQVAALGRRAAREKQGRFLVEGPQSVRELLSHAVTAAEVLYLTRAAADRHNAVLDAAAHAGVVVHECTEQVLTAMADTEHPQGMVAVARQVDVPLEQALDALGQSGFAVVLTHVRDPGNAGTVIRGADAFGASAVLLSDASVDLYNPKVVRATAGSLFHLPICVGTPAAQLLAACSARGIRLLAADGDGTTLLPEADLSGPHAWVMGNEAWGLQPEILAGCDEVVAIPIERAESLNLAMAATVCLHESGRLRQA
ncbi:MAG: RNA methyltransferase [Ornithinimicrobium sp.]|uniref:TrmH family RNA methyltransferase n=1 Tax=Ornithinimicrobium sp. TaxID=1977084 RepID=UPI0026E0D5B6|nr:RNA methyltransferase [Ornithinimicrobium sp.]MDO5739539.1 RNA methyltransferase [Ornithinimicrobium sp.]